MYRVWIVLLCLAGTSWAAEYQIVDLGAEWHPLAISAAGDVAGYKTGGPFSVGAVRHASGEEVLIQNEWISYKLMAISAVGVAGWRIDNCCNYDHVRFTFWSLLPDGRYGNESLVPLSPNAMNDHGSIGGYGLHQIRRGERGGPYYELVPHVYANREKFELGGVGEVHGINSAGIAVGEKDGHAMIWTSTSAIRLDPPKTRNSVAMALNDHGTVTGSFETSEGTQQAFIFLQGTGWVPLPLPPGDLECTGVGVREDGMIFGNSWNDITARIIRWQPSNNGSIDAIDVQTLVEAPGWDFNTIVAVNAAGSVVGYGTFQGQQRAFLLEPIPQAVVQQPTAPAVRVSRR